MLRTLTSAYSWKNHLTQSLFYDKVFNISCTLVNAVLKVKNSMVVRVQNGYVSVVYPRDYVADWEVWLADIAQHH